MAIPGLSLFYKTVDRKFWFNKRCHWLDSKLGPLFSQATAQPIEPQPLPTSSLITLPIWHHYSRNKTKILSFHRYDRYNMRPHTFTSKRGFLILVVFFIRRFRVRSGVLVVIAKWVSRKRSVSGKVQLLARPPPEELRVRAGESRRRLLIDRPHDERLRRKMWGRQSVRNSGNVLRKTLVVEFHLEEGSKSSQEAKADKSGSAHPGLLRRRRSGISIRRRKDQVLVQTRDQGSSHVQLQRKRSFQQVRCLTIF